MTCKVAICDDIENFRRMLRLVLEFESDIEVVGEAGDGRAAVELCEALQPDVLLLDVSMPVMDGLEALPMILETSPETSVVMLTGYGSREVEGRAMERGAFRYLEKGADPATITTAIREACAADEPEAALAGDRA